MPKKKTGNPAGRPPVWPYDIKAIVRLRKQGKSWREVAKELYNCPEMSLLHWVDGNYKETVELSYTCRKTGKLVKD